MILDSKSWLIKCSDNEHHFKFSVYPSNYVHVKILDYTFYANHVVCSILAMGMFNSILWVLFSVYPTSIATVSKLYKANLVHDEKQFNECLVLESPSSSLVECTSLCGPECVYYGFNIKTKKCRVHSCSTLADAVEETGWRYYDSNDPDCKRRLTM